MFGHLPIVFDSLAVAERHKFAFAREEYGRKALQVDMEALGDAPFRLRMRAEFFGGVRVALIESTPYRVSRTRPLIVDGDDKIGLIFPLAGRFGGLQGGKDISAGRGEATIMLADRTGWFGTQTGGTFLTIRVAPELIKAELGNAKHIEHGQTVRPSRLGLDLVRSYLSTLSRSETGVSVAFREIAGRHLAELAVHALCGPDSELVPTSDNGGVRAGRLAAALNHMARNFTDQRYNVGACSQYLGISVRYLQTLFESNEMRFSEELTRLRLEFAHAALSDRANAALKITDIALECGFSDLSHFNRQFRAKYGESPTSVRCTVGSIAAD